MQLGDVRTTLSDSRKVSKLVKFTPNTTLELGIKDFIKWYKYFYIKT